MIRNYIQEKKQKHFTFEGIEIFIQDFPPKNISIKNILVKLRKQVPLNFIKNIDSIYVGNFKELYSRKIDAMYKHSSIFITNRQTTEDDILSDLVHEIAHSVEENYGFLIYGDGKIEEEFGDANSYVMDLQDKIDKTDAKINKIGDLEQRPTTYYETIKEAYEHRQYVDTLKTALKNKQDESNPYLDQIDELQKQAIQEVNYDTVNTMQKLKEHEEFLYKLLTNKDSFIRKKIIDQNLTFLNNRLTHYLDQLGLPHLVTFQNDLSVEITQLGQSLDFDNLSRGERNRLILGMSFAFRDVWENLYQNINLLFLDELIDSGMDTAGVESALAILKKMSRERAKNIFLISHKDELIGRVNNVLRVVKENGFTQYANDVETYEHSR